jgi:DNA damage-binding protein 1
LEKVDAIRVATAPIDIAAHTGGDRILAVSDLMRSVSLIKFEPGEAGKSPKLSEIARHGQSIWGTAVGHIGGDEWIQGDADGNLMILRQPDLENPGAAKDYWGKPKLEVVGEFGLGESINRIRSVKVEPGLKAVVVPRVFAATVSTSRLPANIPRILVQLN